MPKEVKRILWGVSSTMLAIIAWLANGLQIIINTIYLIFFELPKKIFVTVVGFIGILSIVGMIIESKGKGIGTLVGNVIGIILIIGTVVIIARVAYVLFALLLNFIQCIFKFDWLMQICVNSIWRKIYKYIESFEENEYPTKKDRRRLFAVHRFF